MTVPVERKRFSLSITSGPTAPTSGRSAHSVSRWPKSGDRGSAPPYRNSRNRPRAVRAASFHRTPGAAPGRESTETPLSRRARKKGDRGPPAATINSYRGSCIRCSTARRVRLSASAPASSETITETRGSPRTLNRGRKVPGTGPGRMRALSPKYRFRGIGSGQGGSGGRLISTKGR